MSAKHLYINTIGCQMNVYDSGQIQTRLATLGYVPTDDLDHADIIIVNTCAIRAKAEQKAFSFLGRLAPLKQRNPDLIIGIGGCVAQQEGQKILARMPHVDLVFGTHAIGRLAQVIQRIAATRCRVVDIQIAPTIAPDDFMTGPPVTSDAAAFVTIMRGCDNYCTYCVVPYVRGPESSRAPEDIVSEIRQLAAAGVREVTLLGQNVNSYGQKEGLCSFTELLTQVNAIEDLARIRFTTSHPKDLCDELIQALAGLDKLCRHIHLPVQSGSDRILKRMNRRYTSQHYLDKVAQLRQACPDIAITSDIIVGFPGENESDFEATLTLINQVGFDGLFAFMYSDRPNAPAARLGGKVPEGLKKERLQRVLACQEQHTRRKNQALVGTIQEILVDGLSRDYVKAREENLFPTDAEQIQWSGRTITNRIVHFAQEKGPPSDNQILTGRLMNIMIKKAMPHCLWGKPFLSGSPTKGDRSYAA